MLNNTAILASTDSYADDKKLIEPYFDEKFYNDQYGEDLKKTGLSAIDHFMQYGWQGDWKTHRDPNGWFNITLYKDRLWPCAGNPFVDFLKQPKSDFSESKNVDIFVKDSTELYRAWIAAEGFMRLKKCKPIIHLAPARFHKIPDCFVPMVGRGLVVQFTNAGELSFYKSDFIKNPAVYGIDFGQNEPPNVHMSVTINNATYRYIKQDLYPWKNYYTQGRLNPLVINFTYFTEEALHFCEFGSTTLEYKAFMRRIAPGYDLMHTGIEIGTPNERIIPGYLDMVYYGYTDMESTQSNAPAKKEFGVSFLLSLGYGSGDTKYLDDKVRNYRLRKNLFDRKSQISIPQRFYVSYREQSKFSPEYQPYVLPTDSKKWLFETQFCIAMENCKQRNYFTEKLLHCFATLTVPIYIGCPNIADYFDVRGMLIADDVDEAIRMCNSLTAEKYAEMLPYLQDNKKKAEELLGTRDRYIKEFYVSKVA